MTVANVAKVIELVGESPRSWQDAVEAAVQEASKTVHNITGVEVTNWTAQVANGKIQEYKVDVKVAFGVDPDRA
jgi:flavin-binding protein dodecin